MNRDNRFPSKIPFKGRLGKLYRDWYPRIPKYRGQAWQHLNRIVNPEDRRVAVLTRSIRRFNKNRASEASAELSYYSLLSLILLQTFVVSITSLLFNQSMSRDCWQRWVITSPCPRILGPLSSRT